MLRLAAGRLLLAVPVLLGVLLIGFLLMQVVPADPAAIRAGPSATADVVAAIRADLGLDQPVPVQFVRYLGRLLRGDLGVSVINTVPVASELANTVGPTAELMLATLLWAVPAGLGLGTLAAVRHRRWPDRVVTALAVAGVSVPVFFVGLVLIWVVGFRWGLLPFTGRAGPIWTLAGLQSLALPALTLGLSFVPTTSAPPTPKGCASARWCCAMRSATR